MAEISTDLAARIREAPAMDPLDRLTAAVDRLAQFRTVDASGDCCTPALPWGDLDVRWLIDRALATDADADGTRIRYLALDDLVTMRRAVGRPKDLRRATELDRLRRGR